MPNNYPYDRWYWADWFAATRMVSILTRGIWHEMLGLMWMNDRADSLTGTMDELARAAGCSIADIETSILEIERRNLALVAHCNGFVTITCRRYKKANNERKRIREAVHNIRSNKPVTDTRAEIQYPITNIQSTKESKQKKKISFVGDVFFPEKFKTEKFIEAWQGWETFRKEKRCSLTESTAKKQLAMLSEFDENEAISILDKSITNGWQGLFPESVKKAENEELSAIEKIERGIQI